MQHECPAALRAHGYRAHEFMDINFVILMIVKFKLAKEGKEVMMKAYDGKKLVESMEFRSHWV